MFHPPLRQGLLSLLRTSQVEAGYSVPWLAYRQVDGNLSDRLLLYGAVNIVGRLSMSGVPIEDYDIRKYFKTPCHKVKIYF